MGQTASCTPACGDPCRSGGCQALGPGAGKASSDIGNAFAAAAAEGKVPQATNGASHKGDLPEAPAAVQAAVAAPSASPLDQVLGAPFAQGGDNPDTARFGDGNCQQPRESTTITSAAPVRLIAFEARLMKEPGSSFGVAHTQIEEGGAPMLLICDLRPDGPVAKWNSECIQNKQPERALQRGDRIMCIDGKADVEAMRVCLKTDQVRLSVERWPDLYTVPLRKVTPADRFGMRTELIRKPDGKRSLLITQVANGLLSDWNERSQASKKYCDVVTADTEIVQVGAIKGDPKAMQEELLRNTCIDVVLRRSFRHELQQGARRPSSTQPSPSAATTLPG